MSNCLKYSKNGIIRFLNIRERIIRNFFPRIPIGTIGGIDGWYFVFQIKIINEAVLFPSISCPQKSECGIRFFFKLLSVNEAIEFSSNALLDTDSGANGFNISIRSLLNEENGFVDEDGALSIEYGFQVENIFDGIWKFNFFDTIFDSIGKDNMVTIRYADTSDHLYCLSQLISVHSCKFKTEQPSKWTFHIPKDTDICFVASSCFIECLQIAHGVRLDVSDDKLLDVICIAKNYSFKNVVHYCERKLIFENQFFSKNVWLNLSIGYNMTRVMAQLLKKLDSKNKTLKQVLCETDIRLMSGEIMKQCTKYFFDNSKMVFGKYLTE